MAFGVRGSSHIPLKRILQRPSVRSFARSSVRSEHGSHHTYFRHDSPHVYFPENSKILSSVESSAQPRVRILRELADGQKWMIFLGGFLTFPVVLLGYYWGDWAFGSKLWKSDVKELQEQGLAEGSRGLTAPAKDQFMDAQNLYQILQRANAETKALHDLILLWMNPDIGLHAAKDATTIKEHPIRMSDGKDLDSRKAILIRIMDKDNKTVVLLLGVDMSGHTTSEPDPALAWCHDYALRGWLDERAKDLRQNGEAANQGVSLYCYTATSSATSLPGKKGEMWQEARLFPEDLPSGFPLKALDSVKKEMHTNAP